jgi:predicted kinase
MVEIGLAGGMGAGKTTVADILVKEHRYHRLSFADPIRYMCTTLLGRPIDKKHDRTTMQRIGGAGRSKDWQGIDTPLERARKERADALARHIFPDVTEEKVADLYRVLYEEGYSYSWGNENYWMQRWRKEYLRAPKPVAVDDVRFPVEGKYLMQQGFFVVKLEVPFEERQRRVIARDGAWDPKWTTDATEANVDQIPVHMTIDGTGSPEAIAENVYQEALSWLARKQGHPIK